MTKEFSRFRVESIDVEIQEKSAQFISTFSGIDQSQLNNLEEKQQRKVFLGLWKQIDLAAGLHDSDAKQTLSEVFSEYFESDKKLKTRKITTLSIGPKQLSQLKKNSI